MKKIVVLVIFLTFLVSCNKSKNQISDPVEIDQPVRSECYLATYEKDSLDLKVTTLKSGKISGTMNMKLENNPIKVGKISGQFKGDTLYIDYSFIQGTNDKVVFKNPMALLKKKEQLILGNGKIESYLGSSYFAKGEPIDFDNVKYKFQLIKCQE